MSTRMHWSVQHARWAVRQIRFVFNYWWLSRRVEFLEWRLALNPLVQKPQPLPVRELSSTGGHYAV